MIEATHEPALQELDETLDQADWQAADEITFEIMLAETDRQREGWLDQAAIAQFPCDVLHKIDQRWLFYSGGKFGFTPQLAIYREGAARSSFDFSRRVGWMMTSVWRPAGFFNFYSWLTFSLEEAPRGHLPALWFWEMPWYLSWQTGGFGTGRGAGFGDASLFDALMLRLERCQHI
ncbi:GUN4 domain-containing protein [Oscillatoria sp. CS-180]|uniref:GUN4 domain-containing protein n=1 Tax=Oscillatoria sp. CS-180 TaxID=3021720 RepID=UPI002330A9C9|nr:GUN4 domain-containing protein [Oscillatoria sp. CS-180]MDB9525040.1 GUN4 domain-containing protein [Oscillatoria sp. CS-180]